MVLPAPIGSHPTCSQQPQHHTTQHNHYVPAGPSFGDPTPSLPGTMPAHGISRSRGSSPFLLLPLGTATSTSVVLWTALHRYHWQCMHILRWGAFMVTTSTRDRYHWQCMHILRWGACWALCVTGRYASIIVELAHDLNSSTRHVFSQHYMY